MQNNELGLHPTLSQESLGAALALAVHVGYPRTYLGFLLHFYLRKDHGTYLECRC